MTLNKTDVVLMDKIKEMRHELTLIDCCCGNITSLLTTTKKNFVLDRRDGACVDRTPCFVGLELLKSACVVQDSSAILGGGHHEELVAIKDERSDDICVRLHLLHKLLVRPL